jgi:hypothetical protein
MERLIITKRRQSFLSRFVQPDLFVLLILFIGGVISLLVSIKEKPALISFIFIIILGLFLLIRILTEYHRERKTITRFGIDANNNFLIEFTDFEKLARVIVKQNNLDVTLKRSYRNGASRLSIDFWITENEMKKKIFRQHSNASWSSRDVKNLFLTINGLKNQELSQKEASILEDAEFL